MFQKSVQTLFINFQSEVKVFVSFRKTQKNRKEHFEVMALLLFVCLFVCLFVYLSIYPFIYDYIYY